MRLRHVLKIINWSAAGIAMAIRRRRLRFRLADVSEFKEHRALLVEGKGPLSVSSDRGVETINENGSHGILPVAPAARWQESGSCKPLFGEDPWPFEPGECLEEDKGMRLRYEEKDITISGRETIRVETQSLIPLSTGTLELIGGWRKGPWTIDPGSVGRQHIMKNRWIPLCAALAALAALGACSGKDPAVRALPATARRVVIRNDYWPTKGWRTSTPAAQEMDGAMLQAALTSVQEHNLALHGLLVIRHGYIVLEKYFAPFEQSTSHSLYSCTKSFVSALVGIAVGRRYISDVLLPVLDFFPDRSFQQVNASKKAITLENLLTMSSGLDWAEGDDTYDRMYLYSRDWVKFVLDAPMASRPGEVFNYSSGSSHVLAAIIQQASGMNTYDFAREALFHPVGIEDPDWERDPAGTPIGGWGMSLPPRDMAKLGYLYLHEGMWDGTQIVPSSWVRDSTRPHITADGGWEYGFQWWVDPSLSFYAALGRNGQSIFVVPRLDLVAVFTARIDSNDPETDLLKKYIIPACSPPTDRGERR